MKNVLSHNIRVSEKYQKDFLEVVIPRGMTCLGQRFESVYIHIYIHETRNAEISQKLDGHNIYALMKTM